VLRRVTLAALFLCISCGPAKPSPVVAKSPPHEPTWEKLTFEERHNVMTFRVLPNMAKTWQRYEKTDYPETTCARCHGANGEARGYELPNSLAPLDPQHMPDPNSKDPDEAEMARFMFGQVVPEMTALLDAEPYDPKTGRGFYCFECHARIER
jgi:hypothetical protein